MLVFVTWSGATSLKVARALRSWLPKVLQSVDVWVSEDDIAKGRRWSEEIFRKLDECHFGIVCVTPDNLSSEYLHFEAGAISKTVPGSLESGRVTPFLVGVGPEDLRGALSHFQATRFQQDDLLRLVSDLNGATDSPLNPEALRETFEMWWPRLEEQMLAIGEEGGVAVIGQERSESEQLLLDLLVSSRDTERAIVRMEEQLRALGSLTGRTGTMGRPLTREEATLAWGDRVLPSLRPGVKVYMAGGRFLAASGDRLVYALPDRGLLRRALPLKEEVETAFSKHLGMPIFIDLVLDTPSGDQGEDSDLVDPSAGAPED